MSVGASLKSIPARSLLSASFSFVSLAIVVLVPLSSLSSLHHGCEGGGIEVGVAPSYVSGLACEAKDDALVGTRTKERESRRERKSTRKTKLRGARGKDSTIRGKLRL